MIFWVDTSGSSSYVKLSKDVKKLTLACNTRFPPPKSCCFDLALLQNGCRKPGIDQNLYL